LLNYQGKLTDSSGDPVTGIVSVTFAIYDALTGGTQLWSETHVSVTVTNGLFNAILGGTTSIPDSVSSGGERYFQLTVDGETITPRQRIVSVLFALKAQGAEKLDAPDGEPLDAVYVDNDGKVGVGTTSPSEKLELDGAIKLGTTTDTNAGAIRWNGSDFQGYNGSEWLSLTLGGIGDSDWTELTLPAAHIKAKAGGIATNGATLHGTAANTHINLGFGTSVTGLSGENKEYCTIGGGYFNTASHTYSTVGGGSLNTAAGDYSWAGGKWMQLTDAAAHTFVWGVAEHAPEIITTDDAFLIFPAGISGKVGIGTATPGYTLHCDGPAGKPGGGGWTDSSDERLKTDILEINGKEALEKLSQLRGVTFQWINPEEHTEGTRASVLAQELEKVFPEWVQQIEPQGKDKELIPEGQKAKAISFPHDFNAYLIEAIKQLKSENEALKQSHEEVKSENAALKQNYEKTAAELASLKARMSQIEAALKMQGFGELTASKGKDDKVGKEHME